MIVYDAFSEESIVKPSILMNRPDRGPAHPLGHFPSDGGNLLLRKVDPMPAALRANDVETITCREFTLEGRGRNIPWLCLYH